MSFQPTGRAAHPSSRQIALVVHARLRQPDHCGDSLANLVENRRRELAKFLNAALAPIQTPDLIGQNHATDLQLRWQDHLKGIAFHLTGDGADNRKSRFLVVNLRRKHHAGAATYLFVSYLRRKLNPNDVADIRYVGPRQST
jgi:hypothetical protein